MMLREPYAVGWYPDDPRICAGTIESYLRGVAAPELPLPLFGGLVPHAGWRYSGAVAARTIGALARCAAPPEAVVMLGAVHSLRVPRPTTCEFAAWRTPVGELQVDQPLRDALLGEGVVEVNDVAHAYEHSIEVQTPLLRYLLPDAQFLPIAVPADAFSLSLGQALAGVIERDERRVAVLASSDLTHYGSDYGETPAGTGEQGMAFARANDEELLDNVINLDPEGVLEHALSARSACGGGALAAAIVAVRGLGARGCQVLEHTSSHVQEPTSESWVGYAAALFHR
jgi:MEMO1 family protein